MKVFGTTDMDRKGKHVADYPSWYFDQQKEELGKDIVDSEREIEDEPFPDASSRLRAKENLRKKKARFEQIQADAPSLTGADKDEILNLRKGIAPRLSEAHPSRTDKEKGLVDTHEEVRRMTEPVVEIKGEKEAEFAKQCQIPISVDGKVSRNDMDRMYKIMSKMVGEPTDIEYLRRK
jgi:hypothetical protein